MKETMLFIWNNFTLFDSNMLCAKFIKLGSVKTYANGWQSWLEPERINLIYKDDK